MDLKSLQLKFRDALKSENTSAWQDMPISAHSRFTQEECLRVYQNAYWIRMENSLEEDFALTMRYVGYEKFSAYMREFLMHLPGPRHTLAEESEKFHAYLIAKARNQAQPRLEIAATLDHTMCVAFHLPEQPDLGHYGFDGTENFSLSSALLLNHFHLPDGKEKHYITWRSFPLGLQRKRLTINEAKILQEFVAPATLEKIAVRLEMLAIDPTLVQKVIARWTKRGAICAKKNL